MPRSYFGRFAALVSLSLFMARETLADPIVGPAFFVAEPGTPGATDLALARGPAGYAVAWVAEGTAAARTLDDGARFVGTPTVLQVPETTQTLGSQTTQRASGGMVLASNADGYLATWLSTSVIAQLGGSFSSSSLRFATLAPSGAKSGEPTFSGLPTQSLYLQVEGATARGMGEWAVANWNRSLFSGNTPIDLVVRFAEGASLTTITVRSIPFETFQTVPHLIGTAVALASDGSNYLLAWTEQAQIQLARVLATHEVVPVAISTPWRLGALGLLRITASSSGYIVAWEDGSTPGVRVARVDTSGTVLDPAGFQVTTVVPRSLSIGAAGSTALIVFATGSGEVGTGISGVRIGDDGSLHDAEAFPVTGGSAGKAVVAAAGDESWLVAYDDIAPSTLIRARFVGTNSVPEAPDNPTPGSCAMVRARAAGNWALLALLAAPLVLRRRSRVPGHGNRREGEFDYSRDEGGGKPVLSFRTRVDC